MLREPTSYFYLIAATLLAASCTPSAAPDTRAAEETAIRQLDEQWSATAAKNDLEGTLAFYSDDAVLLAPNAPIATDKKSIRASWAGLLGPNTAVSWKVTKVEVAKSGELGYLYGIYQLTIKNPMRPHHQRYRQDPRSLEEAVRRQMEVHRRHLQFKHPVHPAPEPKK